MTVCPRFGTVDFEINAPERHAMIKSELVHKMSERYPYLYHQDLESIVNVVLAEIVNAMKDHDRVELRGFGSFSVRSRDARKGRNPRTGSSVEVEAKRVPFFKAGREQRLRLNALHAPGSPGAAG